jgi:manganese/zinc/iron transport system substrate-binding protein
MKDLIELSPDSPNRRQLVRYLGILLAGTCANSWMGCARNTSNFIPEHSHADAGILRVVATTGMIGDMLRELGGENFQIVQLIQAGVDPHLYRPIRDDIVSIVQADVVVHNGLHLEGRMGDVLAHSNGHVGFKGDIGPDGKFGTDQKNRRQKRRLHLAMADGLNPNEFLGEPGADAFDPHIWMDVELWSRAVSYLAESLSSFRPDLEPVIASHHQELRKKLLELDRRAIAAFASIPQPQRVLISSHDAFQYFGRRYGLEVEGIQGISTASEAGLRRIPELIDKIVMRKIPSVFKESSVAGKLIDALIAGASSRGHQLKLGEELYSDALGPSGSKADTYLGMMEHNFHAVVTALGGTWA